MTSQKRTLPEPAFALMFKNIPAFEQLLYTNIEDWSRFAKYLTDARLPPSGP